MALTGPLHDPLASPARRIRRISWPLVALALAVAAAGLMTLYSVAGGQAQPWMDKQAIRLVAGIGMMLMLALVPARLWMVAAMPAYVIAIILLAGVLLAGTSAMGARRWLQIGPLSLQPSELARIALIPALAAYYQWLPRARVSHPVWVALPLTAIALPAALIVRQPDLGSAVLHAVTGLVLMLLAGVSLVYAAAGGVAAVIAAPMLWARLHDYQRRRIETFLDPAQDPLGAGYHIQQSKIALGSGGLSGKGLLGGTQSNLDFLPEKHTDFIFTAFGEEMGFIGCIALLAVYAALLAWLGIMAMRCRSQFCRLVIAGTGAALFASVAVNIGMVTGVVPVVGVPLPLMSYGGTALLTTLASFGLALSAYVDRDTHQGSRWGHAQWDRLGGRT